MRMTGKIMQNNAINNMNNSQILLDKLTTQISTRSKIVRPSDDPMVAIRALRLRTNLSEIEQYQGKNIPDAKSWLDMTGSSLDTMTAMITAMQTACTDSDSAEKIEDRMKILEDMKALREEIFMTGDASYAGRNIFTGYRTNVKLTFQQESSAPYEITEQRTKSVLDTFTYVDTGKLDDINGNNVSNSPGAGETENDIATNEVTRIRLSYNQLNGGAIPSIKVDGVDIVASTDMITMSKDGNPNPYTEISKAGNEGKVFFVPETGELLLGSDVVADINNLSKTKEMHISYQKNDWEKGDLRPEHYFACVSNVGVNPIEHNQQYLTGSLKDEDNQVIAYDVGFNQDIKVNTLASDVFTHNIGRDMDLITQATEEALAMEKIVENLTDMVGDNKYTAAEKKNIQTKLDAAQKALTYKNEEMKEAYASGITKMQGYLDQTNTVVTNNGSTLKQLKLITERVDAQHLNFKELEASNIGINFDMVTIELSSAKLAMDATLMSVGKIMSNSLMNFI